MIMNTHNKAPQPDALKRASGLGRYAAAILSSGLLSYDF